MTPADHAAAGLNVRPAEIRDIPTIVDFRERMFRELGWTDEARLEEVAPLAKAYLEREFSAGGCSGFVAERLGADGASELVATIVVVWQSVPPGPRNLPGRQAYLLGMYVRPEFRRRGIARALMTRAIECVTAAGVPLITLHASDQGRPLYETLGFNPTHEMRLFTEHAAPAAWRPVDDAD